MRDRVLKAWKSTWLGIGVGSLLSVMACVARPAYTCGSVSQCVSSSNEQGVCMPNGYCAYPDAACGPQGLRYSADAPDQSSACVDASAPAACISQISAGIAFTCAIKNDGSAWCWGANESGQLGDGQMVGASRPHATKVALPAGTSVTTLTGGENHACALTADGRVFCWGGNDTFQLGQGADDAIDRAVPVEMSFPAATMPIKSMAVGGKHTCVVDSAETLHCWGENDHGECGQLADRPCPGAEGSERCEDVPVPTPMASPGFAPAFVSLGDEFSCATDDLGEVRCWGDNNLGELGTGASGPADTTVPQETGKGSFLSIDLSDGLPVLSEGSEHACIVSGGSVFCWGNNASGQVGIGTKTASEPTPKVVGSAQKVVSGSAAKHTCSIGAAHGSLTCWGNNQNGEMGLGDTREALLPANVPIAGVRTVALGERHTCALVTGGALYCWGNNDDGQLGLAAAGVTLTPTLSPVANEICQ